MCVCVLFLCVFWIIHLPLFLLSNQEIGNKQSSDGGDGQAQPGGSRQTGCGVAQVGVTACLGHAVDAVVISGGKVHILGLVAFGHF